MNNILSFENYMKKINEGLIKTHDIDKSVDIIEKFLSDRKIKYELKFDKKTSDFSVKIILSKYLKSYFGIFMGELRTLSNNLGYFPSTIQFRKNKSFIDKLLKKGDILTKNVEDSMNEIDIYDYDLIYITYESYYDKEVKNIPSVLYHVADINVLEKIKKSGLVPKSRNKNTSHPERIYFTMTFGDALFLQNIFIQNHKQGCVIIKLVKPENYKFFQDPRGGFDEFQNTRAIYTYQNINPKYLEYYRDESDINKETGKYYFGFRK